MGTPSWQKQLLQTLTRMESAILLLQQGQAQIVARLDQIVDNTAVGPRSLRGRVERIEQHLGLPAADE